VSRSSSSAGIADSWLDAVSVPLLLTSFIVRLL
jgi:hypothetical protein